MNVLGILIYCLINEVITKEPAKLWIVETGFETILSSLDTEHAADIVEEMNPDAAADLLAELPEEHSEEILTEMEPEERQELEELMEFEEDTAAGRMTTDYMALLPSARVAYAIEMLRHFDGPLESMSTLFLVDKDKKLVLQGSASPTT